MTIKETADWLTTNNAWDGVWNVAAGQVLISFAEFKRRFRGQSVATHVTGDGRFYIAEQGGIEFRACELVSWDEREVVLPC